MTNTKQDERTPGLPDDIRVPLHSLQADVGYLFGRVAADSSCAGAMAQSVRDRLNEIERAYGSTDALRSALAEELVWHEAAEKALSKQPPSGDKGWRRAEHQERIEAIRAALSASPPPSTEGLREWQPIETAPKDGTWILGWAEGDANPARISWGRNHNCQLAWCTAFCSLVEGYITHWMPLPPAPDAARTALAGVTAPQEVDGK